MKTFYFYLFLFALNMRITNIKQLVTVQKGETAKRKSVNTYFNSALLMLVKYYEINMALTPD